MLWYKYLNGMYTYDVVLLFNYFYKIISIRFICFPFKSDNADDKMNTLIIDFIISQHLYFIVRDWVDILTLYDSSLKIL